MCLELVRKTFIYQSADLETLNFENVGTEQGYIKRRPGVAGVETQKENMEMEAHVKVKVETQKENILKWRYK